VPELSRYRTVREADKTKTKTIRRRFLSSPSTFHYLSFRCNVSHTVSLLHSYVERMTLGETRVSHCVSHPRIVYLASRKGTTTHLTHAWRTPK
jgi:hypothetical protein